MCRMEALERLKIANNNEPFKHVAIWNSDWNKMKCLPAENFTIQVWLANQQQMKQLLDANYNLIISHVDAWYFGMTSKKNHFETKIILII